MESKYYGVSFGNGDDGVSHSYPDYIVKTDNPWALTRLAVLHNFSHDEYVKENLEVDGDEDFCISGIIYNHPDWDTWCEVNGAWFICEVFPTDLDYSCPVYESLDECFGIDGAL